MTELERYYRVLELEPGASLEEINQAYKDLAFVWHPDRIPQENERLREKAVKKLQDLNEAREKLRSLKAKYQKNPAPKASTSQSRTTTPKSSGSSYTEYSRREPRQQTPREYYRPEPHPEPKPEPEPRAEPAKPSDLSGKDFSHANLSNKDLSGRNLSYANLSKANLSDTFMHKAILRGANLSEANLFRANLLLSDMREVNLRSANLIGADLSGADLRGADLTGARVRSGDRLLVKLIGANLSGAIMPDGSIHE
jgi:curved DNA-binding protein CbpA